MLKDYLFVIVDIRNRRHVLLREWRVAKCVNQLRLILMTSPLSCNFQSVYPTNNIIYFNTFSYLESRMDSCHNTCDTFVKILVRLLAPCIFYVQFKYLYLVGDGLACTTNKRFASVVRLVHDSSRKDCLYLESLHYRGCPCIYPDHNTTPKLIHKEI